MLEDQCLILEYHFFCKIIAKAAFRPELYNFTKLVSDRSIGQISNAEISTLVALGLRKETDLQEKIFQGPELLEIYQRNRVLYERYMKFIATIARLIKLAVCCRSCGLLGSKFICVDPLVLLQMIGAFGKGKRVVWEDTIDVLLNWRRLLAQADKFSGWQLQE
ncbi:hypothetical protein RJT34_21994 [Clitoria ternatea]|uniref:Uncharacterized protein n=1 Tax=Clitoria ternatea TaxID=43366 RepID=A0AAN9IUU0_CLITE